MQEFYTSSFSKRLKYTDVFGMKMNNEATISRIERRRNPRFRTTGYILINQEKEKNQIMDISLGGLRILSFKDCNAGEVLELKIFLQNGFRLETKACVVWTMKQSSSSRNEIGIKFVDLSLYDMNRLGYYLSDRPGILS